MPVRINFLAEAIAAEEDRRNDPVKRSVWIGAFLVFLVLLWYSTLLFEQMVVSSRLEEKKTEWSRLEPSNKELREASNGIRDAMTKITALDRLSTNRFLWAPVLNALQYTMVEDRVQLVRLSGQQRYVMVLPPKEEAKKKESASSGKVAPAAKKKKKSQPASSTEKILLTLDARDVGNQGEQNFNAFIDAIGRSTYFKSRLETDGVRLAKLLPPSSESGNTGKPFTQFTVECKFPDKERK
jgi:hypothetical protein